MSTITNSNLAQNFNKSSKYSPAKNKIVSPNHVIAENMTPKSRVRTYTSPVF